MYILDSRCMNGESASRLLIATIRSKAWIVDVRLLFNRLSKRHRRPKEANSLRAQKTSKKREVLIDHGLVLCTTKCHSSGPTASDPDDCDSPKTQAWAFFETNQMFLPPRFHFLAYYSQEQPHRPPPSCFFPRESHANQSCRNALWSGCFDILVPGSRSGDFSLYHSKFSMLYILLVMASKCSGLTK